MADKTPTSPTTIRKSSNMPSKNNKNIKSTEKLKSKNIEKEREVSKSISKSKLTLDESIVPESTEEEENGENSSKQDNIEQESENSFVQDNESNKDNIDNDNKDISETSILNDIIPPIKTEIKIEESKPIEVIPPDVKPDIKKEEIKPKEVTPPAVVNKKEEIKPKEVTPPVVKPDIKKEEPKIETSSTVEIKKEELIISSVESVPISVNPSIAVSKPEPINPANQILNINASSNNKITSPKNIISPKNVKSKPATKADVVKELISPIHKSKTPSKNDSSDDESENLKFDNVKLSDSIPTKIDWEKFEQTNKVQNELANCQALLKEKESELDTLSEALLALKDELSILSESDVQLKYKENKQLSVQIEKEQRKSKTLAEQLLNLQNGQANPIVAEKPKDAEVPEKEEDSREAMIEEIASLKAKYNMANKRMLESRQAVTTSKAECVRLTRIVQREVGEDANDLIEGKDSNWIGRSQKIQLLQNKIKEYKEKENPGSTQTLSASIIEQRYKNKQEITEVSRRAEMEKLSLERDETIKALGELKLKSDAYSSRIKILEKEQLSMKSKLKILLDKSEADDALIDQLKTRPQSNIKPAPIHAVVEKRQSIFTEQDNNNLNELKRINSQQSEQMENQKRIIIALRDELTKVKSRQQMSSGNQSDNYDRAETEHQLQFAILEAQKARELCEIYRQKINEDKPKTSPNLGTMRRDSKAPNPTSIRALAGRIPSSMSTHSSLSPLASNYSNNESDTLRSELEIKEQELRNCQELLTQMRLLHQRSITDLRNKLGQMSR